MADSGTAAAAAASVWSMNEAVAQLALALEERWVRLTPAGRALCLRTFNYVKGPSAGHVSPTLTEVREYVLRNNWSSANLERARKYLLEMAPKSPDLLRSLEETRFALYADYRRLRNLPLKDKALLAGFLQPPHSLQYGTSADHVVACMLQGPNALCRNAECLATFQELLQAYQKMNER